MKSDYRSPLQFTFPPSPRASATPLRSSAVLPLARLLSPFFPERRGRAADINAAIRKLSFIRHFCAYETALMSITCNGISFLSEGAENRRLPYARSFPPVRPRPCAYAFIQSFIFQYPFCLLYILPKSLIQ